MPWKCDGTKRELITMCSSSSYIFLCKPLSTDMMLAEFNFRQTVSPAIHVSSTRMFMSSDKIFLLSVAVDEHIFPINIRPWTALEFASNLQHSGKLRHPTPQFQQFHSFGPVERCKTTLIWEQHKYLHHESDCVGAVDLSSECSGSKASNSLWLDADDSWLLLIARGSSWTTVLDSVPVVGHLWPECRAFNRPSR